jgi:hypothetical protein
LKGSVITMVTDLYQDLLQQLLTKYRQGRDRPILIESVSLDEDKIVSKALPDQDRLLIGKFENARIRGVLAARRKQLDTARHLFAAARSLLDANLLSDAGQLLFESSVEQGESFLDCRDGNFEQARQRTFYSLALDQELEDCYGYDHLILHRIQQVQNLSRIEAYDHQPKRAMKLVLEVLGYLDGRLDQLSVQGKWGYDRIARQAQSGVVKMFIQVTGEIALIMAGMNCCTAGELFTDVAEELLMPNYQHSCHPHTYSWLLVKQAYSRGDLDRFLILAADFLAQRSAGMGLLLYSTLVDLIIVCDRLKSPAAIDLKQEIIGDVMNHSQEVHPRFLPFFQTMQIDRAA